MATIAITLFLIRFHVCKMDDKYAERTRNRLWSMNSQRLEEIVAELMKPIKDIRHTFDTDLCMLLEEYLTEAGLHVLDNNEDSPLSDVISVKPNFAELALLLQQSACIYGKKVDFLYQHVVDVSESLHNSTLEIESTGDEPASPSKRKRKRKSSVSEEFSNIELEEPEEGDTRLEAGVLRPPPTLPRAYVELEPRVLADVDEPLRDYAGEPIGIASDYHVAWRLQNGILVEDMETSSRECRSSGRPPPTQLLMLQEAIDSAAPSAPPSPLPFNCSTPEPDHSSPTLMPQYACPLSSPLDVPTPLTCERKRKTRVRTDVSNLAGLSTKLVISKRLRLRLRAIREFALNYTWIRRVVRANANEILRFRRTIDQEEENCELRGFETIPNPDFNGFIGWSESDASQCALEAKLTIDRLEVACERDECKRASESDDDGFFERLSLSDVSDTLPTHHNSTEVVRVSSAVASWQSHVLESAVLSERQGFEIRAEASRVLQRLPSFPQQESFQQVVVQAASDRRDVSRLLLATLFLANAGNVEILRGPPLSHSFSLRLISTDENLYCAALAADQQLMQR